MSIHELHRGAHTLGDSHESELVLSNYRTI